MKTFNKYVCLHLLEKFCFHVFRSLGRFPLITGVPDAVHHHLEMLVFIFQSVLAAPESSKFKPFLVSLDWKTSTLIT